MKNVTKWMVWFLLISMLLSACAVATQPAVPVATKPAEPVATKPAVKPNVKISFWTLSSRKAGVEAIMEGFRAANPDVTVEVVFNEGAAHRDGLKIAASSKSLPSVWFNWGGTLGGFYAEKGLLKDLTGYAKKNNWDKKFDASALSLSTLHGQLTGYPTSLSMLGVFYRTDVFKELGIKVPTTFEEFETALATLKKNKYTPITTAGGGGGWLVMRTVEQLIEYYAGAELHDSLLTFKTSHDNKAVVQALTKYKEWVDKGYFNEGFVSANASETATKLYSKDAVMVFEGQAFERNVLQAKLDNSLYGYFPFPSGGTNRMSGFVEMYQFNAKLTDAELDAAVRFMDYYYSKNAITANPANYKYPVPIVGIEIPKEFVNTLKMVADIAKNKSFTITDQAFPTEVANVLFSVQDEIALGRTTPEKGAAAIQAAITAYLANK